MNIVLKNASLIYILQNKHIKKPYNFFLYQI
jgi:hypothetical protein